MYGIIFSIEEFSVYDGPGIRSTVFLKGCPLKCSWCHNPEGQSAYPEFMRNPNGCVHCGSCMDKSGRLSEESIKKCPMNLIRKCGENIDSEELCARLSKNADMYSGGGGVTFSGGEPLYQSDFLLACLEFLKGKVHTVVQTSGFCTSAVFERVLASADYFLFDLKLADEKEHIRYTGVSNKPIRKNFERLAASGKSYVTRIPLIPGVTDTERNIEAIAEFMNKNGVFYAELMPYNKMAGGKYKAVGREYLPEFDPTAEVKTRKNIFKKHNIEIKIL